MDVILRDKYSNALKQINPSTYYWYMVNDEVFRKQFGNIAGQGRDSDGILNLISEEILPATNSMDLYQTAIKTNPDASNNELFEIMKELLKKEKDINVKTRKR